MDKKLILNNAQINWKLLHDQKYHLIDMINWHQLTQEDRDVIDGIVNFIDYLQDSAVDENGFTKEEVFGPFLSPKDYSANSPTTYRINDDGYVLCTNLQEFRKFCEEGDWGDEHGFYQDTGVTYQDLRGLWFLVIHSRVHTLT